MHPIASTLLALVVLLSATSARAQEPGGPAGAEPATGAAGGAAPGAPAKKESAVARLPFNQGTVLGVVKSHLADVQGCYEQAMAQRGSTGKDAPGGRVVMAWLIDREGLATNVEVKSSALGEADVGECMALAIRNWEFPKPPQPTPIEFPFDLKPWNGSDSAPARVPGPAEPAVGATDAGGKGAAKDKAVKGAAKDKGGKGAAGKGQR